MKYSYLGWWPQHMELSYLHHSTKSTRRLMPLFVPIYWSQLQRHKIILCNILFTISEVYPAVPVKGEMCCTVWDGVQHMVAVQGNIHILSPCGLLGWHFNLQRDAHNQGNWNHPHPILASGSHTFPMECRMGTVWIYGYMHMWNF